MRNYRLKIILKLLMLVKPLSALMGLTIVLGTLGFLSAQLIAVVGTYYLFQQEQKNIPIFIALVMGVALFKYFEQLSGHYIAFKLLATMRDKLFAQFRQLAPAKLETQDKGNLIALVTADIELIEVFYAHTIAPVGIAIVTSGIMVAFFYQFDIALAILAAVAYGVIGMIIPVLNGRRGKATGQKYRLAFGELNSLLLERLRGIKEIIQFNGAKGERDKLRRHSQALNNINLKLKLQEGHTRALSEMLILVTGVVALMILYQLKARGGVANQEILVVMIALLGSFGPTIAISALSNDLLQTLASGERIISLLEESPKVHENTTGLTFKTKDFKKIECEGISFSYEEQRIISHLQCSFEKGQITGIKGLSGSGKSTLLKLLMGFWPTDEGRIQMVDQQGHKTMIHQLNTKSLRQGMSYVTQDTYLFNDTIRNNITLCKDGFSEADVIKASQQASIHTFIESLPNGYETHVGELGGRLSGGERQRIGLARAFISKAPIILLDEPTSHVDSLNEGIILKAIEKAAKNCCVILVSHRDSTLSIADKVYSMKEGQFQ